MVVDAHIHITEDGNWFDTNYNASYHNLIGKMDAGEIDISVILPIAPIISNKYVHQVCGEYPDRLVGFASVNPLKDEAPDVLEKNVKKFNLKGLKLHPNLQKFDLLNANVIACIKKASSMDIPVVIDTWFKDDLQYKWFHSGVKALISKLPDLKLILPHLGGPIFKSTYSHENVFYDLSFIFTKMMSHAAVDYMKMFMKQVGASRLIYGSDFPEINPIYYLKKTREIFRNLKTSLYDRELIFTENIRRLCGF